MSLQPKGSDMTLTRRSLVDLDWPNWMTQWAPFERSDA